MPDGTIGDDDKTLFDTNPFVSERPQNTGHLSQNIWTEHKAELISRYLWSFLSVTKNGTYIDAFAGPQHSKTKEQSWAAKRVLDKQSVFLNRACLFELDEAKRADLEGLVQKYHKGWTKLSNLQVIAEFGDSNKLIPEYLKKHPLRDKKACFALLDQRTHECTWELVKRLAEHKRSGTKIEQFYFLAQGWMNRSVKSATTPEKLAQIDAWWGGGSWKGFIERSSYERAQIMKSRFRDELGYKFAAAFPMNERGNEGRTMFWLIHASDHPRANPLMELAYRGIGLRWTDEEWMQTNIEDLVDGRLEL